MENILRFLSLKKEYRMTVVDTSQLSQKLLQEFNGSKEVRKLIEQVVTSCTLLVAIDNLEKKLSFSFRLTESHTIFFQINYPEVILHYSDSLTHYQGSVQKLFDKTSSLSVTVGDWKTGIHTSTIEADRESIEAILEHFTIQSEQLVSYFITTRTNPFRGILLQPLPFADETDIQKEIGKLRYLSEHVGRCAWREVEEMFSDQAIVIARRHL